MIVNDDWSLRIKKNTKNIKKVSLKRYRNRQKPIKCNVSYPGNIQRPKKKSVKKNITKRTETKKNFMHFFSLKPGGKKYNKKIT